MLRIYLETLLDRPLHVNISVLLHSVKNDFTLIWVPFSKRYNLGYVEKAIYFSHQHLLIINFYLNISIVKFYYLSDN